MGNSSYDFVHFTFYHYASHSFFPKVGDINSSNFLVSSYMLSHDLKCRLDLRLFGHGILPKRDLKISPIKFSKMMW